MYFRSQVEVTATDIDREDLSENTLLDIFEDAILFVTNLDKYSWFANPITDQIAPGYSKTIANPMDLSTIRVKVQRYTCLEELSSDIELMLDNCMDYNIEGAYYEGAHFILGKWKLKKKVLGELLQSLGEVSSG